MASFTLVTRDIKIMCMKTKLNNKITLSIYKYMYHAQFSVPYLDRTAE